MPLSWKDFEKKVEKLRVNYEKFVGEVVNNPNGTTQLSKEEQEVLAEYPFAPPNWCNMRPADKMGIRL